MFSEENEREEKWIGFAFSATANKTFHSRKIRRILPGVVQERIDVSASHSG